MGLLDDLKKQADQVKTQQLSQTAMKEESVRLVEDKMKQTFLYLNDLLKQLAVLKPVNPIVFTVPGVGDLKDMAFKESFIDYRKKKVNDRELYDAVNFFIKWAAGTNLVVERDMPPAALKVREALFAFRLKFTEDETKNQRGAVANTRFTVESTSITDIVIKADHDQARLLVTGKNLMRLGTDDFVIPAAEINEAFLEDFAKTLLGHASNFRKFRVGLGR